MVTPTQPISVQQLVSLFFPYKNSRLVFKLTDSLCDMCEIQFTYLCTIQEYSVIKTENCKTTKYTVYACHETRV